MTKNVMIIEDNEMNLEVLVRILRPYDINVQTAMDGREGWDAVFGQPPGLLLLDLQLPGLTGEEILSGMKSHDHLSSVPVIVITAKTQDNDEAKLRALGAKEFVRKPISVTGIRTLLDKFLERKEIS